MVVKEVVKTIDVTAEPDATPTRTRWALHGLDDGSDSGPEANRGTIRREAPDPGALTNFSPSYSVGPPPQSHEPGRIWLQMSVFVAVYHGAETGAHCVRSRAVAGRYQVGKAPRRTDRTPGSGLAR